MTRGVGFSVAYSESSPCLWFWGEDPPISGGRRGEVSLPKGQLVKQVAVGRRHVMVLTATGNGTTPVKLCSCIYNTDYMLFGRTPVKLCSCIYNTDYMLFGRAPVKLCIDSSCLFNTEHVIGQLSHFKKMRCVFYARHFLPPQYLQWV